MKRSNYSLEEIKEILTRKGSLTGKMLREVMENDSLFALPYFSSYRLNGDMVLYTKNGIGLIAFSAILFNQKELLEENGFRMMELKDINTFKEAVKHMRHEMNVIDFIINEKKIARSKTITKDFFLKKIKEKKFVTDEEIEDIVDFENKLVCNFEKDNTLGQCFLELKEGIYTMNFDRTLLWKDDSLSSTKSMSYSPLHEVSKEELKKDGWEQYDVSSFRPLNAEDENYLERVKKDLSEKVEKLEFAIQKQSLRKMLKIES